MMRAEALRAAYMAALDAAQPVWRELCTPGATSRAEYERVTSAVERAQAAWIAADGGIRW